MIRAALLLLLLQYRWPPVLPTKRKMTEGAERACVSKQLGQRPAPNLREEIISA